jgi:ActR/RegA family two-component response regulator
LVLETEGMEVSGPTATTADALRLATEQRPSLAIVDVNLKGEMANGLIDQLHDQRIRIVLVSGYAVLPRLTGRLAAVLQKAFQSTGAAGGPAPRPFAVTCTTSFWVEPQGRPR